MNSRTLRKRYVPYGMVSCLVTSKRVRGFVSISSASYTNSDQIRHGNSCGDGFVYKGSGTTTPSPKGAGIFLENWN